MTPQVKLQHDLTDLLDASKCTSKQVLTAVTEALVHRTLHKSPGAHIHADERGQAHNMLSWWFSALHEQDVQNKWNEVKKERLFGD